MASERRKFIPMYQQIANILRARVVSMEQEHPVRLPTEVALSAAHGAARETIRRALAVLAEEGLIRRSPRAGTTTLPQGIRAWRRAVQAKAIRVVTGAHSAAEIPGGYYGQVYQGILTRANPDGYYVSEKRMGQSFPEFGPHYVPEDPATTLGVILAGVFDERVVTMHVEAGYPVVCADYWAANPRADTVVFDCFNEGRMAVNYLMTQGHRDLFYLGNILGMRENRRLEPDAEFMLAGCRDALAHTGLSLPADRVHFCRAEESELAEMVKWFVSLDPKPTAGVIFSHVAAESFRNLLGGVGLACPLGVSLISKAHGGLKTDITAIWGDAFRLGQIAVEMLLDRGLGKRDIAYRVAIASAIQPGTTVARLYR